MDRKRQTTNKRSWWYYLSNYTNLRVRKSVLFLFFSILTIVNAMRVSSLMRGGNIDICLPYPLGYG